MSDGYINNNVVTSVLHGIGVLVTNNGDFTMSGGTISNNIASIPQVAGAGVYVEFSSFKMTGGYIINNTATAGGGGVRIAQNSTFYMSDGIISGNNTASAGGGVAVFSPNFNLFQTNSTFTMTGGTISNNHANGHCGGVQIVYHASFSMYGGYILNNSAGAGGGGVRVMGAEFYMSGGTISGNFVPVGAFPQYDSGGGVEIENFRDEPAIFEMSGGHIYSNRAWRGAGVSVLSGTFTMSNGIIQNNRFNPDGGQPYEGGGVRVYSEDAFFTMTGGTIGNPVAPQGNTGTGNVALSGAGVWVGGGATFNMDAPEGVGPGGRIFGNHQMNPTVGFNARLHGGSGVMVYGPGSEFNMNAGYVEGNRGFTRGAGVAVFNQGLFNMTSGSIRRNDSSGSGSGVAVDNSTFNMSGDAIIERNHVFSGAGGGVVVLFGGHFEMSENAVIRGNAVGGGVNVGSGGGVSVEFASTFTMYGGRIYNHRHSFIDFVTGAASGEIINGGGVYVGNAGSYFNMYGGTIGHDNPDYGNQARHGGGVFVIQEAVFNMQVPSSGGPDGIITGNTAIGGSLLYTARGAGGGVYITGHESQFNMYAGSVYRNRGNVAGAGVGLCSGAEFNMSAGEVSHNFIIGYFGGNGVYLQNPGTTFNMTGGRITHNTVTPYFAPGGGVAPGGGIFIQNGATVNISGSGNKEISYNSAHGASGILNRNSHLNITGTGTVNIQNNHRITTYMNPVHGNDAWGDGILQQGAASTTYINATEVNIRGHDGVYDGGAVQVHAGIFTMHDGTNIYNNVTAINDRTGGILVSGGILDMRGGEIHANIGPGGGGVRVQGTGIFNMHGGDIFNHSYANEAGDIIAEGGGVHVTGSDARFNMFGGTIGHLTHGNQAYSGGGVWVSGGARFYMQGYAFIDGNGDDAIIPGTGNIVGNEAIGFYLDGSGGGVTVIDEYSYFEMSAGIIEHNHTNRDGGGVSIRDEADFVMDGGIIQNNDARQGGGVHIANATFTMNDGTIRRNNSIIPFNGGGGVFVVYDNGDFEMFGGFIYENNSLWAAGGVLVAHGASFEMHGGIIEGNTAEGIGGGGVHLWRDGNTFIMHGGIIRGNAALGTAATQGGGGVSALENNTLTINGGEIYNNTALRGGGVWIGNSTLNMHGGVIRNNRNATPLGGDIEAGGGVWVNHFGDPGLGILLFPTVFNMYGGTIGALRDCGDNCDEDCLLGECITNIGNAAVSGGGVWIGGGATFNIRGINLKNIIGNEAEYDGGGIWLHQNGTMYMEAAPMASNLTISQNTAGRDGGGIFTQRYDYRDPIRRLSPAYTGAEIAYSNVTLQNGVTFEGNTASRLFWPPSNRVVVIPNVIDTSQPATVPTAFRHPLNNYDINFRVTLEDFDFLKTNSRIYGRPRYIELLPGAEFRLFRAHIPEDGLATQGITLGADSSGLVATASLYPLGPWQEVLFANGSTTMSSTDTTPISFSMDPRFTYQLVEVAAPTGFQLPGGQWRFTHDIVANAFTLNHPQIIGHTHMPGFVEYSPSYVYGYGNVYWYLGNFPTQNLPFTGGDGEAAAFMVVGASFIGAALLFVFVVVYLKNKKDNGKQSISRYLCR